MGLTAEGFNELVGEIESQGFDPATAARFACLIGDTPCFDEDGQLLVIEAGQVIASLKPLDFFLESPSGFLRASIPGDRGPRPPPDCIGMIAHLPEAELGRLIDEGRFDYEVLVQVQQIAEAYEVRFGNFGEIARAAFRFEKRFEDLLSAALRRGVALTPAEVAAVFPAVPWED